MNCPYCGHRDSRVMDSRPAEEGSSIRRRRECLGCLKRFTTYETVESLPMVVIKKDGSRQSFDREKVTASMRSENLMHLKAEVNGPEGNEYDYQWQVSVDGGESYEDMEDQNEDWMDIELDEENVNNLWRVRVHTI